MDENPRAIELTKEHKVKLSKDNIKAVLTEPWSGSNYSQNIWINSYIIAKRAEKAISKNIIAGRSIANLTKDLEKIYGSKYKSNIERLLRTETAYIKGQADLKAYDRLDIKEYEILATLDKRTSSICRDKDGEHYPLDEAKVGENYPPFHPNCRTTTIKYIDDENREGKTRLAKDKDGKNVKVPLNMKYDEWLKWVEEEKKGYDEDKNELEFKPLDDKKIQEFQNKSDEIYAKLSKDERAALSDYTQGGYIPTNEALSSGEEDEYEKPLNRAIKRFELQEDIIAYRGTSEKYYLNYKVGDVFEGKVFYSTSVNYEQAKVFADDCTEYDEDGYKGVLLEIRVPKGTKALYIGENTDYRPGGVPVNEYELLLSNKTKYQFKKTEEGKIILEVKK